MARHRYAPPPQAGNAANPIDVEADSRTPRRDIDWDQGVTLIMDSLTPGNSPRRENEKTVYDPDEFLDTLQQKDGEGRPMRWEIQDGSDNPQANAFIKTIGAKDRVMLKIFISQDVKFKTFFCT
mgnify:CR=1 FL=1